MKKILSIALALALCISVIASVVYAAPPAADLDLPALTIATKAGSSYCTIGYRVTQIDEDNAGAKPYISNGKYYIPVQLVADTYGLDLSALAATTKGGVEYVDAAALGAYGLYVYTQTTGGTAQNVCMISSEYTKDIFTSDPYNSSLIRIPSVEMLLDFELGASEYVWVELPKETYDMLYSSSTYYPGIPEEDMASYMRAGNNADLYLKAEEFTAKNGIQVGTITSFKASSAAHFAAGGNHTVTMYIPNSAYLTEDYLEGDGVNLIVFLDGSSYYSSSDTSLATALDNMIASKSIRPTVALFIDAEGDGAGVPLYTPAFGLNSRSDEYDSTDSRFGNYLADVVLPAAINAAKTKGASLTWSNNVTNRAIVGFSSSSQAALAACYHRNDTFGAVISTCGTFANLRQGNLWWSALRANELKDIKFFLMEGELDLDIVFDDHILNNAQLAQSLEYRGYEFIFVENKMGHSNLALLNNLPSVLGWLWNDRAFYSDYINVVYSSDPVVTAKTAVSKANAHGVVDTITVKVSETATLAVDIGDLDVVYYTSKNEESHFSLEYLAGRRGYQFAAEADDDSIAAVSCGGSELKGGAADTLTVKGLKAGTTTITLKKSVTATALPEEFLDAYTATIVVNVVS